MGLVVRPVEVHRVQIYEDVRRSVLVEGKSLSKVSRELGLNWRTVKKMTQEPVPPGYRREEGRARPVLGPYLEEIAKILKEDEDAPVKQRHTGQRVFERLRDEFGYKGGSTQVRAYVSEIRQSAKEAFVPLVSFPGYAEADFKESVVEIAGVRVKAHTFVQVLPHSGVWFCRCYPKENAESFADGHVSAFDFFGGVPKRCTYDNAAYSVKRGSGPLKGRTRTLTDSFSELKSAFLFEADFAAPRKGNEKGSVERRIGVIRSRLFVPVPKADSWEELNRMLLAKAEAARNSSEAFKEDVAALLPLRSYRPESLRSAKVDKLSLVRYDNCFYSVPTRLVGRSLLVRGGPFEIEILNGSEIVARHHRLYEPGRISTDLSHYIDLLELKPRAVARALPVVQAKLPPEFEAYRRRVEDGTGVGDRRYVGVLRLATEFGVSPVKEALLCALSSGFTEPSDVRLLVLRQMEGVRPASAGPLGSPHGHGPVVVERIPLSQYGGLMAVAG
jgi:transposase